MKNIITKIKERLNSKGLIFVSINKAKYKQQVNGSCTININPNIKINKDEHARLKYHINAATDILRVGIEDINKL